jgi:hypothetical protein
MKHREGFGPGLRAHRERCGLTLESIAKTTKIKASLLAALERNDVSQWPSGIFRRAFLRSYAHALGLDPEPLVSEFQRFFPEEGTPDPSVWIDDEPVPAPRLTLAQPRGGRYRFRMRALSAAAELALVVAAGWLVWRATGADFWLVSGIVALVYYPVATVVSGRTIDLPSHVRNSAWATRFRPHAAFAEKTFVEKTVERGPDDALDDLRLAPGTDEAGDEFRPPQTAIH